MRFLLLLITLFVWKSVPCQICVDEIDSDSLMIFFDSNGEIINSNLASYYRVFKRDRKYFPFDGNVKDYYIDGQLAFVATYINGFLEGEAKYYDYNGNTLIDAKYKDGIRNGIWKFYYPDKRLKKRVSFNNDTILILDFYTQKGKQLVINGTGKYKDNITIGKYTGKYKVSGRLIDGLMDGNWSILGWYGSVVEKFNKGQFVKGTRDDGEKYKAKSTLDLSENIVHENFNVFKSLCYLDSEVYYKKAYLEYENVNYFEYNIFKTFRNTNIFLPLFKGNDLNSFLEVLKPILNEKIKNSFWCYLEFEISRDGKLMMFYPISSTELVNSKIISILWDFEGFSPAFENSNNHYTTHIHLLIFKSRNNIYIPKFELGFEAFR